MRRIFCEYPWLRKLGFVGWVSVRSALTEGRFASVPLNSGASGYVGCASKEQQVPALPMNKRGRTAQPSLISSPVGTT